MISAVCCGLIEKEVYVLGGKLLLTGKRGTGHRSTPARDVKAYRACICQRLKRRVATFTPKPTTLLRVTKLPLAPTKGWNARHTRDVWFGRPMGGHTYKRRRDCDETRAP